ncbi:FAD-dependent oxidoreductase [Rhodohalobacter sulfatireducens]|uniref:FAD-dependent oxidoreductase n=1 Tax=Rhodohalobacter sulfatireducens TaxID=2911366 RepID=A0ABS9KHH3_9BACT|nr:FAD-dependent oxidoreductase [Rhodohalobacter sulfatireducens]MCG2590242.1 FAD-dependent oxidoreductase [Rhodohalobacter sulfatireducens]
MAINRRDFLKNSFLLSSGIFLPSGVIKSVFNSDEEFDVVVYGATSAGIIAGVAAAKRGRSVIIVEPSNHLGGLTSGGLSQTDIGVEGEGGAIGGMSLDFYKKVRQYYLNDESWKYQTWDEYMNRTNRLEPDSEGMFGFEPKVARMIYEEMLEEAGVPVVLNDRILLNGNGVEKRGDKISAMITEDGNVYRGKVFMDATYESDLMAMAGVSYTVGRESNGKYDEHLNGVQTERSHNHIFNKKVDPYIEPGQSHSGVLPGIDPTGPGEEFSGDHRVQAYCYRMCLTDVPENQIPIEKPEGYEDLRHELLFRNFEAGDDRFPWINSPMPNRKTDINNRWAVSTNNIGMNYDYPDGDHDTRDRILEDYRLYQQGHMWAMANHPRVPEHFREEYSKWGLAADEYPENGNWTPQIYVREARRMIGEYVMTEHDCRRMRVVEDSIGLGSYNMDSHNVQRYITKDGYVQNEGNLEYTPGGPYAISYRSLTPKREECTNLLVCCNGISASHISFGSIRMEPVFMILGQSSAVAADIAINQNGIVQDVPYRELRSQLLKEDQRLDVDLNEWPPHLPEYS